MSGGLNTNTADHTPVQPVSGPHHVDLRTRLSPPELRNTGTITIPANLHERRHVEAALPLPLHQDLRSDAGLSTPNRDDAARNTAVSHSLSPLDKDERLAGNSSSPWEIRRTDEGTIYFVNHDTGLSTCSDPLPLPGYFTKLLAFEREGLPLTTDPLPQGWVKGRSKSGQVYFTDPQTRYTTRWDPRVFMKQLPSAVKLQATKGGSLQLSYERLGKRWSTTWESPSEALFGKIVQTVKNLEATADGILDALDVVDTLVDTLPDSSRGVSFAQDGTKSDLTPGTIGLAKHIVMVENVCLPFIQEIVEKNVDYLDPLIKHISRAHPRLATNLALRLFAFAKVWGSQEVSPHGTIQYEQWDAICTWPQFMDRSESQPLVTFLTELPPSDDVWWESKAQCRVTFILVQSEIFRKVGSQFGKNIQYAGIVSSFHSRVTLGPRLLVLIDSPDPPKHLFDSPQRVDKLRQGVLMLNYPHNTGGGRLNFIDCFSGLLLRSLDSNYDYDAGEWANYSFFFMPCGGLQWNMTRYAWETFLSRLREEIEHAETMGHDEPNVDDLRRINILRRLVQEASKHIDDFLKVFEVPSNKDLQEAFLEPFRALERKAATLKQDINDATTLIIGAISVMDAGDSRTQARRATALTALAAILPASVTSYGCLRDEHLGDKRRQPEMVDCREPWARPIGAHRRFRGLDIH